MSALDELKKKNPIDMTMLEFVVTQAEYSEITGNAEHAAQELADKDAELLALRERVAELESERRFIDGIVMGDGNHDKVMLTKDAMIFMQCMKLLGLDVSGCGPESIVDAIATLKSQ